MTSTIIFKTTTTLRYEVERNKKENETSEINTGMALSGINGFTNVPHKSLKTPSVYKIESVTWNLEQDPGTEL
jgi:hypothetical protein